MGWGRVVERGMEWSPALSVGYMRDGFMELVRSGSWKGWLGIDRYYIRATASHITYSKYYNAEEEKE